MRGLLGALAVFLAGSTAAQEPTLSHGSSEIGVDCRPRAGIAGSGPTRIHRWTDAEGRLHFSDRPPPGSQAVDLRHDALNAGFALELEGDPEHDPPALPDALRADGVQIFKILSSELGLRLDRGFRLRVTLVADHQALGRALNLPGPAPSMIGGLYRPTDQRLYVVRQRSEAATRQVLRHEVSHAILHELVGLPPSWLNEGLAEYFASMRVDGMGARIDSNPGRLADAREHLDADASGSGWRRVLGTSPVMAFGGEGARLYALGWATVFHLMADAPGRAVLAALLNEQRRTPCRPIDGLAALERLHPGGAAALHAALRLRLRDAAPSPQHF